MESLITLEHVSKKFQGREVLTDLNLSIYSGEVVAMIGENGAGKSTTISLMLGIGEPSSGVVKRWREDYKPYIGAQLQTTPFFEGYTCRENLEYFAALYDVKITKAEIENRLKKWGLEEAKNTLASKMSLGQQKRLAIAVTTLHEPKLIILDEPTAGLDPRARHDIRKLINNFASSDTTIIFSSHDMEEVGNIATRIIFLHKGKILVDGTPDELLQQNEVADLEELYLKLTENEEDVSIG